MLLILLVSLLLSAGLATPVAAAPEGQLTWAVHVSLAPTWFDPAETSGIITPYMLLYALHDAMVKPMPGNPMTPSLAESWTRPRTDSSTSSSSAGGSGFTTATR